MLELPETTSISASLREFAVGKMIMRVLPPTKVHKFCWYNGDPAEYGKAVEGCRIISADGFGIFAEISMENGYKLCFNDGVNVRLTANEKVPENYQLLLELDSGKALVFTVAMYGGIILHRDDYNDEYYVKSKLACSPFASEFEPYFYNLLAAEPNLSIKAFLTTKQRFPGIGNGVLQDILFEAKINPRRKVQTLSGAEKDSLLSSVVSVLRCMTEQGGRDTEKGLLGRPGGYATKMSRNTLAAGCPVCGGPVTKEAYLGGAVYYCPVCQPK